MREREPRRYDHAVAAAEAMHFLMELEYEQGERDPDAMLKRLKDLSAYSLTHAEIMGQREGVELLALARFFGMTSDARFHNNQERLGFVSEEVMEYEGQAEVIEGEVAARCLGEAHPVGKGERDDPQPRLF